MSPTPDATFPPEEIRGREFPLADRGYDRLEVRAFLAELADRFPNREMAEHEERLVLVLDAAKRAIDAVRLEASEAIDAVRRAAELLGGSQASPAVPAPPVLSAQDDVRTRVERALHEVEAALGSIEAGKVNGLAQRATPSTSPSS